MCVEIPSGAIVAGAAIRVTLEEAHALNAALRHGRKMAMWVPI